MALIGYARVSTAEQDTALQTDALRKAGCERVFEDTGSGAQADRPGLAAFALTTDTSVLTAIGNDYGYEHLFARQVEALGNAGDVFIGISTSGRSPNILKALQAARSLGLVTVGLTGRGGGRMAELCDHCLRVPSDATPRIQEGHITIGHTICWLIEQQIFPRAETPNAGMANGPTP